MEGLSERFEPRHPQPFGLGFRYLLENGEIVRRSGVINAVLHAIAGEQDFRLHLNEGIVQSSVYARAGKGVIILAGPGNRFAA